MKYINNFISFYTTPNPSAAGVLLGDQLVQIQATWQCTTAWLPKPPSNHIPAHEWSKNTMKTLCWLSWQTFPYASVPMHQVCTTMILTTSVLPSVSNLTALCKRLFWSVIDKYRLKHISAQFCMVWQMKCYIQPHPVFHPSFCVCFFLGGSLVLLSTCISLLRN